MRISITAMITDTSIRPDEFAQAIEDHGFDGLYVPEHTHIPVSRATPAPMGEPLPDNYRRLYDPFVALTAAAMATSRIALGTGVCLVAERDPITTAKAVASLDHLSGGRFRFGVGFGWNREEMEDHGVAFRHRREVTRESVLLMRSLWEDEVGSFDGEHVSVSPSSVWPRPTGRVPVWLGGKIGPKFLAALVDYCDGWIPMGGSGLSVAIPQVHAALEQAGRDPSTFDIIPFGSVPTPGKLEYFASLGVTEVVCNVADPSRDAALRFLEDARVTVDTADVDA